MQKIQYLTANALKGFCVKCQVTDDEKRGMEAAMIALGTVLKRLTYANALEDVRALNVLMCTVQDANAEQLANASRQIQNLKRDNNELRAQLEAARGDTRAAKGELHSHRQRALAPQVNPPQPTATSTPTSTPDRAKVHRPANVPASYTVGDVFKGAGIQIDPPKNNFRRSTPKRT